eukprot:759319-Hanusia_phi.AAC.3
MKKERGGMQGRGTGGEDRARSQAVKGEEEETVRKRSTGQIGSKSSKISFLLLAHLWPKTSSEHKAEGRTRVQEQSNRLALAQQDLYVAGSMGRGSREC